jgi:hypothetical protein
MRKKRVRKDEKREVTPEFVNMSKEILYPQIQGVTATSWADRGSTDNNGNGRRTTGRGLAAVKGTWRLVARVRT